MNFIWFVSGMIYDTYHESILSSSAEDGFVFEFSLCTPVSFRASIRPRRKVTSSITYWFMHCVSHPVVRNWYTRPLGWSYRTFWTLNSSPWRPITGERGFSALAFISLGWSLYGTKCDTLTTACIFIVCGHSRWIGSRIKKDGFSFDWA